MSGTGDRLRLAGGHQHGRQCLAAAGQGHDVAVHLLWRLVAHRHGLRHGPYAGLRPRRPRVQVDRRLALATACQRIAMTMRDGTIVLAAGGTGGHLFPAQALAEELIRRGYVIHLMTDERVRDYGSISRRSKFINCRRRRCRCRKPWLLPQRLMRLARGLRHGARASSRRLQPARGRRASAAIHPFRRCSRRRGLQIPSLVHEQNAVMGRANRVLARLCRRGRLVLSDLAGLPTRAAGEARPSPAIRCATMCCASRRAPYHAPGADEPFQLLVFGGSQGARFFAEFMPRVMRASAQGGAARRLKNRPAVPAGRSGSGQGRLSRA